MQYRCLYDFVPVLLTVASMNYSAFLGGFEIWQVFDSYRLIQILHSLQYLHSLTVLVLLVV